MTFTREHIPRLVRSRGKRKIPVYTECMYVANVLCRSRSYSDIVHDDVQPGRCQHANTTSKCLHHHPLSKIRSATHRDSLHDMDAGVTSAKNCLAGGEPSGAERTGQNEATSKAYRYEANSWRQAGAGQSWAEWLQVGLANANSTAYL
jgi:hypothetical protein